MPIGIPSLGGSEPTQWGDPVLSLGWRPLEAEGSGLMETEFPPLVLSGSVLTDYWARSPCPDWAEQEVLRLVGEEGDAIAVPLGRMGKPQSCW